MSTTPQQLDFGDQPEPFDKHKVAADIAAAARPGGEKAAEARQAEINDRRGEDLAAPYRGPAILTGAVEKPEDTGTGSAEIEALFAATEARRQKTRGTVGTAPGDMVGTFVRGRENK